MKVIKVSEGFFKDTIVVVAEKDESCEMGTICGTRKYHVSAGKKFRMKVPKKWCAEVGDNYKLSSLVYYLGALSEVFPWSW
jgi:hypothetical protein